MDDDLDADDVTRYAKRGRDDDMDVDDPKRRATDDIDDMDVGELVGDFDLDNIDPDLIDKIVDSAPEIDAMDVSTLKKLLIAFEKAFTNNQLMRTKFPDTPEKFMASEVELYEEVKKLQAIATAPELYPQLIKTKSHLSLVALLNHENTDIVVDVIDLFKELVDEDVLSENPENVTALISSLLDNDFLELLFATMKNLKEDRPDEKAGVFRALEVFENFAENASERVIPALIKLDILSWLMNRICVKEDKFDHLRLQASELLAVIVPSSKEAQIKFAEANQGRGMEQALVSLAAYKKINPTDEAEEEFIENLFLVLYLAAPLPENKPYFKRAEGLHLINILIKNKKYPRKCAIKLLDYLVSSDKEYCAMWVELGGLGSLFGAFMRKGAAKHKKGYDEASDDEHSVSAILALLQNLEQDGKLWQRIILKFEEQEFEKVERLLELHEKYLKQVAAIDLDIEDEMEMLQEDGIEIGEKEELEFSLRRLGGGLFTLQRTDHLLAYLCHHNDKIKAKTGQILNMQNRSFEQIKKILNDCAASIGDSGDSESEAANSLRVKIQRLAHEL